MELTHTSNNTRKRGIQRSSSGFQENEESQFLGVEIEPAYHCSPFLPYGDSSFLFSFSNKTGRNRRIVRTARSKINAIGAIKGFVFPDGKVCFVHIGGK